MPNKMRLKTGLILHNRERDHAPLLFCVHLLYFLVFSNAKFELATTFKDSILDFFGSFFIKIQCEDKH